MKNKLLLAAAAAAASSLAHGQTPPAEPASQGLEEVTVTAQRRSESLQTVPIAVSAFTASQLESRQITSTIDLVKMIPNLLGHNNTGTSTANTYFIRGLGSTEQIATLDPPVSTYVDDVIIPRQNANNYALFDVERLEVLRGPQGTTFGRNSTGGAINVITRKPGTEFGGSVSVGAGSFGKKLARGSVDIPFSERALSKFSAFWVEDDGYLTNTVTGQKFNGSKNAGARVALRFPFSNDVTWDIAAEYLESDGVFTRGFINDSSRMFTPFTTNGGTSDTISDMINKRGMRNETDATSITSNVQWQWGGATLNAITGYRTVNQVFVLDFGDPNPFIGGTRVNPATNATYFTFAIDNDGKYDMLSQEIKATGSFADDRVKYVAGVYYFYEDNTTKAGQATGSAAAGVPLVLSCSAGFFGEGRTQCSPTARGYSSARNIGNETTSYAAYAQFDWKATDRVTLIAGARFTDDKKDLDLRPTPQGGMITADLIAAGIATKLTASLVTPKAGVNFQVNDDVMLYASATRGFKSGGWNARTAYRPQEFQPMVPEKTWSYELGVKSELFDRRLRMNANVYFQETTALQLSYTTPGPIPGTSLSTQDNAGDIEAKGFELEFAARFNEFVDLYGSLGLQDGEYTFVNPRAQSSCSNTGTIVNGACAPMAPFTASAYTNAIDPSDGLSRFPETTANLGINFNMPAPGLGGDFRLSVEGQYTGKFWTTASNAQPTFQIIPGGPFVTPAALDTNAPGYELLNLSLGYQSEDGKWKALLDCKNCTDEEYKISVFNGIFYGDPRRVSFSVGYKF